MRALATITSCPNSLSKRLIQGEFGEVGDANDPNLPSKAGAFSYCVKLRFLNIH